ncbi:hypothetical protein [Aureispira anguillae]|uniref:Uncharacterized protein n=1 Tax=Aureispira anguillae TaxID=2864201 RepID=A0A915Y9Y2_9BACT|nr:hypothetical protein [Aureispira anguillae]BDS09629.1 hypothetical protein AsAng_0003330 [Aureispira anguillae]
MIKLFNSTTKFQPREFGYKPRYYDADKEALERRIKGREEANAKGALTKMRLRQEFGNYKSSDGTHRKGSFVTSSSFRLLLIIILLSMASYIVLDSLLPQLLEYWFPLEHQEYELLEKYY